jgi:hypothetical protein
VDQREPDACALVGAAPAALKSVEAAEDVGQLVVGNADAGVAHGELGVLGPATRASSTVLAASSRPGRSMIPSV